jgi:hypothetical protein
MSNDSTICYFIGLLIGAIAMYLILKDDLEDLKYLRYTQPTNIRDCIELFDQRLLNN